MRRSTWTAMTERRAFRALIALWVSITIHLLVQGRLPSWNPGAALRIPPIQLSRCRPEGPPWPILTPDPLPLDETPAPLTCDRPLATPEPAAPLDVDGPAADPEPLDDGERRGGPRLTGRWRLVWLGGSRTQMRWIGLRCAPWCPTPGVCDTVNVRGCPWVGRVSGPVPCEVASSRREPSGIRSDGR